MKGAAIAQWICLRLPSCHPRFESQAHHLSFHQFVELFNLEKDKNKQKEAGIGPYLQKVLMNYFKTSVFTSKKAGPLLLNQFLGSIVKVRNPPQPKAEYKIKDCFDHKVGTKSGHLILHFYFVNTIQLDRIF